MTKGKDTPKINASTKVHKRCTDDPESVNSKFDYGGFGEIELLETFALPTSNVNSTSGQYGVLIPELSIFSVTAYTIFSFANLSRIIFANSQKLNVNSDGYSRSALLRFLNPFFPQLRSFDLSDVVVNEECENARSSNSIK